MDWQICPRFALESDWQWIGIDSAMDQHCIDNGSVWRVCYELRMMASRDSNKMDIWFDKLI